MTLTLFFEKSNYSDFLAMPHYMDQADDIDGVHSSRREHYIALNEAKEQVIPELHSDLGVALLVVTTDNHLVLTKRKKRLAVSPGLIHFSCHEGMARGGDNPDFDDLGRPSPMKTAIRSADQELKIDIQKEDINWIVFGHDRPTWEYNLFGVVRHPLKWDEIRTRKESFAKDASFEHTFYEPPTKAEPKAVVDFLILERNSVASMLPPCLFYAMINITGDHDGVAAEFERLRGHNDQVGLH